MTDERKNDIWAKLPDDFRKRARYYYLAADIASQSGLIILEGLFGKHNLTATEKDKPSIETKEIRKAEEELQERKEEHLDRMLYPEKYCTYEVTLDEVKPDWLAYRMELAKAIAVAYAEKGRFEPQNIAANTMLVVDGIVKRLKGGDK